MENSMTDHSIKEDKQKLQLPKNIRQIGNMQGAVRIYVEDYVYTYLHGSGRSGWAHKGSIFLGSRCQESGQKYIFISGLVHIPDENFRNGVPEFTDLMWGGIYQDMKQYYAETGKKFEEVEFEYQYDVASFLQYYAKTISLAGLERITGVNQKQLGHYISGYRHPSQKTAKKIEDGVHRFSQELSAVRFV